MKGNKSDKRFLRVLCILNLVFLIPIILRKPPIKDWIVVYLFNAVTNGIIDKLLTSYNIVKYPVRFVPKIFNIHILFDFLLYPTFTILYNQVTMKDKPFAIFYKLLFLITPAFLIEVWAVSKTHLIKWKKGWNWYHTFISIMFKSLLTRSFIGIIRKISEKQKIRE
ncbi:CBO0543 family protein [Priestia filamentosa]|uniref:CBO0543 family protein n=1 Tax=Priestia filamentosa TaxID=1402861 RepID=UPI003979F6A9